MNTAKNLKEFLSFFVDDISFEYVQQGRSYFLKNPSTDLKIEQTPLIEGLPLGREDNFFKPSLFLLELISKQTKNKIFINANAEWLFLCGRDIFLESIEKNNSKNKIFLVQNNKDENLGLGMKTKHKGKTIVKNLIDRGDFLRREK